MARLGDICTRITDGSHNPPQGISHSEYLMLSSKNIYYDEITLDDPRFLSAENYETENKRTQISTGDILLTIVGTVGRAAVVPNSIKNICLQRSVAVIKPKSDLVDSRFLMYQLQSMRTQLEQEARGVAQKGIYLKQVENLQIKVPSLDEQLRVVKKLDKVSKLIALRKEQLTKLDQLVKSRFIELFGDRYTNDKKWDNKPLYECADFYNGKAHEQVVDENGEYILVTSRCIASDISDYRRTNALLFPLQVNDIAMVMSDVPNGRALAKCVLIDEDGKYTLNQRICCLRNYSFNPIFFYYLLNRHEYFLSFNDGNAQTNLRKDDLLACNIIIPPMELQEQFAAFVEQTDKSKLAIQQSLDKLELLKKSLMQEYFG